MERHTDTSEDLPEKAAMDLSHSYIEDVMERHTDTSEDLPEKAAMDPKSECTKQRRTFTATQIPEIEQFFNQADTDDGGGLDIDEFCKGLKEVFGTEDDEELTALFYQIDTNCDGTVDLCELVEFLFNQMKASESLYEKNIFPKPFKVTPTDHYKEIVEVIFRPYEEEDQPACGFADPTGKPRTYQKGQYISISSDGILTIWSDRFDSKSRIPLYKKPKALPFSHHKKMHINGMAYINDLKQVAVATSEREVLFYTCNEFSELFSIHHALIVEDNIISAIHYWSNGTKAVLSFGDAQGYLYVLIFEKMNEKKDLFNREAYEKISLRDYPTLFVSNLLKNTYQDFQCVKIPIFNDTCTQIQYFPSIDSLAICGSSSKTMVLVTLPTTHGAKLQKTVFESPADKEFFTCVEYSSLSGYVVTGGTDGLVREWFLQNTMSCQRSFEGHVKPITHISRNPTDKVIVTLSKDKNIFVWSEEKMLLLQKFQVQDMNIAPIASMCYNTYNNELVLANTEIGTNLGRGTDVFQNALTSHDKPLCCALYHSIYKQVVSVCQDGVVTVWDILTGKAVVQFKLTPDNNVGVGHTAITFDGSQRRLITLSPDGKLRLWNFSSGALLAVHPVTLPKEETCIVCLNDRVFVSGRNSKIIYDLDMEGYDNRFLEHNYLNDISSMDVHENTLTTASSNGNIVIWNANNGEVRSWINGSKSPRVFMAGKKEQGRTGRLPAEKNTTTNKTAEKNTTTNKTAEKNTSTKRTAVKVRPLITCLKKREVKVDIATLLTSADGYICAWSVNLKGGLLGKFRAVDEEGAVITTMSTDVREDILITGDSIGKICQWDIRRFGFGKQAKGPFEVTNGWHVSLAQPPLLGTRQCHLTEVVSVQFDGSCKKVITAGSDCQLRLWTNTGSHIGLFGKDVWDAASQNLNLNLEETADQDEAANSTTVLLNSQKSVKDFLPSLPLPPIPDWEDDDDEITEPFMTKKQLDASCRKLLKYVPGDGKDFIKNMEKFRFQNPEAYKIPEPLRSFLDRYKPGSREVDQGSERTSKPSSQDATPTSDCMNATNGSLDIQQSADTVKQRAEHNSKHVHLPPISEKVQLTNSQTINQTRSKNGRLLKKQQGDMLQDSVLAPCSPSTLKLLTIFPPMKLPARKCMQPPVYTLNRVRFLSKQERVQIMNQQTGLKPQPPQSPLIRGGADLKQSSPQTLNQISTKYGRVLKNQQGDELQDSVLAPYPLSALKAQNHPRMPRRVRQLEPMLIRGGAEMKKRSPQIIDKIMSKYENVFKNKQGDTLKDSILAACPPSTLKAMKTSPDMPQTASKVNQSSVKTSEDVSIPPIWETVQLTHEQTGLKPQPPQSLLIRGAADLKKRSPQIIDKIRSKYGRVLKNQQGDKLQNRVLAPCPPWTLKILKTSPDMPQTASKVNQSSVKTSKVVAIPPICERFNRHQQTELKPKPPLSTYGRVPKKPQGDPLKHDIFTICPPSNPKPLHIFPPLKVRARIQPPLYKLVREPYTPTQATATSKPPREWWALT